jgi:hypothetical protein
MVRPLRPASSSRVAVVLRSTGSSPTAFRQPGTPTVEPAVFAGSPQTALWGGEHSSRPRPLPQHLYAPFGQRQGPYPRVALGFGDYEPTALDSAHRPPYLHRSGIEVDGIPRHRRRLADAHPCREHPRNEVPEVVCDGTVVRGESCAQLVDLLDCQCTRCLPTDGGDRSRRRAPVCGRARRDEQRVRTCPTGWFESSWPHPPRAWR